MIIDLTPATYDRSSTMSRSSSGITVSTNFDMVALDGHALMLLLAVIGASKDGIGKIYWLQDQCGSFSRTLSIPPMSAMKMSGVPVVYD